MAGWPAGAPIGSSSAKAMCPPAKRSGNGQGTLPLRPLQPHCASQARSRCQPVFFEQGYQPLVQPADVCRSTLSHWSFTILVTDFPRLRQLQQPVSWQTVSVSLQLLTRSAASCGRASNGANLARLRGNPSPSTTNAQHRAFHHAVPSQPHSARDLKSATQAAVWSSVGFKV